MERRNISRADLENALANHHTSISSDKSNSVTYIGPGMNGADLKVWVLPPVNLADGSTIVIKSAAWKDVEDPA